MATELKAIETRYAGCRFRSRLEARWAVFFDALGVKWEYEPQGFDMDGERYLPDFWLPDLGVWWEVKGEHISTACDKTIRLVHISEKPGVVSFGQPHEHTSWAFTPRRYSVYLAGKMTDWRSRVIPFFEEARVGINGPDISEEHGIVAHAFADKAHNIWPDDAYQIEHSDFVFAWINSPDCYGTICEIGYARGCGVEVWMAFSKEVAANDFWLVADAACSPSGTYATPEEAVLEWMADLPWDRWPAPTVTGRKGVLWGLGCRGERTIFLPVDRKPNADFDWGHWYPNQGMRCDEDRVEAAEAAARSARFEFGEQG